MKAVTTREELDAELSAHAKVIVDCHALWCGPCKKMMPLVEGLDAELESVHFLSLDIDEAEKLAHELGVEKLPTFLVFKDHQRTETLVGQNEERLKQAAKTLNLSDDAFSNTDF